MSKPDYSTTRLDRIEISLGGNWAFFVDWIKDQRGVEKCRAGKGKRKPDGDISQVQKLNFKSLEEAEAVFEAVKEMFQRHL